MHWLDPGLLVVRQTHTEHQNFNALTVFVGNTTSRTSDLDLEIPEAYTGAPRSYCCASRVSDTLDGDQIVRYFCGAACVLVFKT